MKLTLAFDIYNKEEWISPLLGSWLFNLSKENKYEFIVVFDNLKDKSRVIADRCFERFGYLYLPLFTDNKFEVFCNNLALQYSTGDYIIFIQDDNFIYDQNWDLTLTETIARVPNLGIIGFLSGLKVSAPPIRYECIEANRPHKREYFKMRNVEPCELAVWQVDAVNRPFCINRELLGTLGGLDKAYEPTYGDDFDLSLKLLREGKINLYIPFDLKNIGAFKETLDRELFKKAKQKARLLWRERYSDYLAKRENSQIRRLFVLKETENGLESIVNKENP